MLLRALTPCLRYRERHPIDLLAHPLAALEFDGVREAFLHEPCRSRKGLLGGTLVGAEGEVGDDECVRGAANHATHEREQFVDGDRSSTWSGGLFQPLPVLPSDTIEPLPKPSARESEPKSMTRLPRVCWFITVVPVCAATL